MGSLVFIPAGAEAVKIRFHSSGGQLTPLVVEDGPVVVRAKRLSA